MITTTQLTIYNLYINQTTRSEVWQRTQIGAVVWQNRKAANVRSMGGQMEADQATIFIPLALGGNYYAPHAWQALTTKTGKWTLQQGDVVVRGLVTDEIHDATTDPITHVVTPAFTMTSLREKYDGVLAITSVDDYTDRGSPDLRHWQVGAK